jgi:hypothetical protein
MDFITVNMECMLKCWQDENTWEDSSLFADTIFGKGYVTFILSHIIAWMILKLILSVKEAPICSCQTRKEIVWMKIESQIDDTFACNEKVSYRNFCDKMAIMVF